MLFLLSWLLVIPSVIGHAQMSGKIMNGFNALIEKYPFQVALLHKNSLICGGTIISKNIIITAAHCVYKGNHRHFKISAGSETYEKGTIYKLSKIILHPYYNESEFTFDIAILKLDEPLKYSKYVKPIEIQARYVEVPDGTKAFVSGWGILKHNYYAAAKKLQAAEVRVISNEKCKKIYANDLFTIGEHNLCAVDQYRGSCSGDSGGPLTANNKLIGVVSFGVHNCDPPNPGVYVNVSYVRDFIDLYY